MGRNGVKTGIGVSSIKRRNAKGWQNEGEKHRWEWATTANRGKRKEGKRGRKKDRPGRGSNGAPGAGSENYEKRPNTGN